MGFIKRLFTRKKVKVYLSIIFLIIIVLFLWRGCRGPLLTPKKTYLIARSENLAPLKMQGKEPNFLAFESDIVAEVAALENLKFRLITVGAINLFDPLNQDYYDAILLALEPDSMMKERYYISDSMFDSGAVLVVPSTSNVTTLKEIQGQGIGIESGSSLIFKLSQQDLLLVSYSNMISALDDLDRGIIAGVIMDSNLAYVYTNGFYKDRLKVASSPLTNLGVRIVARDTPEEGYFIEHFNEGLKKLRENGRYDELIEKWELIHP